MFWKTVGIQYRLHVLAVVRTNSHKNRQPAGGPGCNSLPADRLIYLAELERGKGFNYIQGMDNKMEILHNIG
jgi:hypothetical protein